MIHLDAVFTQNQPIAQTLVVALFQIMQCEFVHGRPQRPLSEQHRRSKQDSLMVLTNRSA
jgi:hypothetical protein